MFVTEDQASLDNSSMLVSISNRLAESVQCVNSHSTNEILKALSENKQENIQEYIFKILTLSHEKPSIHEKATEIWEARVSSSSNHHLIIILKVL